MRESIRAESPLCFTCEYLFGEDSVILRHACKAYPFGIPDAIIQGFITHDKVFEDQEGEFIYKEQES